MEDMFELFPLSQTRGLIARDGAPLRTDVHVRESRTEAGRLKVTFTVPGPRGEKVAVQPEFRLESN